MKRPLIVAIAAAAACASAATAQTTIEMSGRSFGGNLDTCGAGISPCPWAGIRAGEFVHVTFQINDTSGSVLTTYPTGDIRSFALIESTYRITIRGQTLGIKRLSQFNPVINVSNNAPAADGFFIFGTAGGAHSLIPVGQPTSAPVYYGIMELHNSTGAAFTTSDFPTIQGTSVPGIAFDTVEWGVGPTGDASSGFALDQFIIRAPSTATGACCPGDGFCVITSQAACPGTWSDATPCASVSCDPAGACCTESGGCLLATQSACAAQPLSIYLGNNTACVANVCPPPGACCISGTCLRLIESACTAGGGAWLGAGVSCAIQPQHEIRYPGPNFSPINDATGLSPTVPGVTTSSITLTDTTVIQTLEVWVGMFHGRLADIRATLTGPNGTTLDLFTRPGTMSACSALIVGPQHAMDGNYIFQDSAAQSFDAFVDSLPSGAFAGPGRFQASGCDNATVVLDAPSPAGFGGVPLAGTWTLTLIDHVRGVTGNLGLFGLSVNGGAPAPCDLGRCCIGVQCSVTSFAQCAGQFTAAGACEPGACAPAVGACCCGSTCTIQTLAACTGANVRFVGAGTACNPAGNVTAPCCKADFNQTGAPATVQDIFDFLAGYFTAQACADFNGGGVSVQDIFDFLAAYFGGC